MLDKRFQKRIASQARTGEHMKRYPILATGIAPSRRRTLNAGKSILDGARTVTLFSDMNGVRRRVATDGIASDWQKVGSDFWTAIAAEKSRREREAG